MPAPPPDRAGRLAELALSFPQIQRCSWRSVALLADIAAGHAKDLDPGQAQRFAQQALEAAVTAEVMAARQTTALAA